MRLIGLPQIDMSPGSMLEQKNKQTLECNQDLGVLPPLPADDDAGGIAPICCIKPVVSLIDHCSTILPSLIVRKPTSTKETFL